MNQMKMNETAAEAAAVVVGVCKGEGKTQRIKRDHKRLGRVRCSNVPFVYVCVCLGGKMCCGMCVCVRKNSPSACVCARWHTFARHAFNESVQNDHLHHGTQR